MRDQEEQRQQHQQEPTQQQELMWKVADLLSPSAGSRPSTIPPFPLPGNTLWPPQPGMPHTRLAAIQGHLSLASPLLTARNVTSLQLKLPGQQCVLPDVFVLREPLRWGWRTSQPLTPAIWQPSLSKPFPPRSSRYGDSTRVIGGRRHGDVSCSMASL